MGTCRTKATMRLLCMVAAMLLLSDLTVMRVALGQGAAPTPAGAKLTPDAMDTLVGPIALYPDALILQIVQCAGSPYQVKQVNAWLKQNPTLKGTAAQDAASAQGFDISFVAIVLFPPVLNMMDEQPDWTRQLGQAFATDKDGVFASIQRLRTKAQELGNLKTTEQQQVQTVATDEGQQVIVIQPANPQVVYVPQYNPEVVYVQSAPTYTSSSSSSDVAAAAVIGFAAGVVVGALADDDDHGYYYACGGWGYARPVCYPGGWNNYYNHREDMANDYYRHRENMANDYYDHRENMAGQRGDNQANRQDSRSSTRDSASQNQANRADSRSQTRDTANQNRSANQSNRQSTAQTNQASRQSEWQSGGGQASRGAYQNRSATGARQGTNSDAFSGYQRGSTERASSARGHSSKSRSSASRGGGRSGGGRRR